MKMIPAGRWCELVGRRVDCEWNRFMDSGCLDRRRIHFSSSPVREKILFEQSAGDPGVFDTADGFLFPFAGAFSLGIPDFTPTGISGGDIRYGCSDRYSNNRADARDSAIGALS